MVRGYRTEEYIRKNYPEVKIFNVKNNEEAIKLVSEGKAYATIDSLLVAAHLLKKLHLVDLKIAGKTNISNQYRLGIIKNNQTLKDILSKAVLSLEEEEKQKVLSKHLSIVYEKKTDYDLILKISLIFLAVLLLLVNRHFAIKKINRKLEKKMKFQLEKLVEKDRMIFQQNKLASMGEMLENIAHQWRQPLSQINSAILVLDDELYQSKIKNKKIEEKLTEIERITKYMSHTIDDFRTFNSKNLKKDKFYLDNSIENVVSIIKSTYSSLNIDLKLELEKELSFYGYENEFKQVIMVILNNAKDVLLQREIKNPQVKINLKRHKDSIFIEICDNAGGIEKDIIDKIFEPYFTTKHKSQGTGLGLYIAKKIIHDRLEGKLYVKNIEQKACFFIKLGLENV